MSRAAAEHPLTGFGGGFLSVARKVAENPQNLAKAPPDGRPWRVLDSPNFSNLWRPSSQPMPVFCAKHRFVGRFSTRHSDGGEKGRASADCTQLAGDRAARHRQIQGTGTCILHEKPETDRAFYLLSNPAARRPLPAVAMASRPMPLPTSHKSSDRLCQGC